MRGLLHREFIHEAFPIRDANGNGYFCYRTYAQDMFHPLVIYFTNDDLEGFGPH